MEEKFHFCWVAILGGHSEVNPNWLLSVFLGCCIIFTFLLNYTQLFQNNKTKQSLLHILF